MVGLDGPEGLYSLDDSVIPEERGGDEGCDCSSSWGLAAWSGGSQGCFTINGYGGDFHSWIHKHPISLQDCIEPNRTASGTAQPLPVSLDHLQVSIKISVEKHFIHSPHFITAITTHHKTTPCQTALQKLPSLQKPSSSCLCIQALTLLSFPHTPDCWGKNSTATAFNKGWASSGTNAEKCSYRSGGKAARHKRFQKSLS